MSSDSLNKDTAEKHNISKGNVGHVPSGFSQRPQVENKAQRYALTAISALIAESLTFPLDITKTRLQLQNELGSSKPGSVHQGMIATAAGIVKNEGITGLYQGLPPALLRHIVYSGIRIGIYEHIRDLFKREGEDFGLWKKAAAGALAGVIGQMIASPTDLVKVRLQAQQKRLLEAKLRGTQTNNIKMYKGTIDAFSSIAREEGVRGLWKGVGPNVYRAALVNLGELATYDQSKEILIHSGYFGDTIYTHTAAGILSGLAASIASCPADVVKTRMMNQYMSSEATPLYRNSFDCLVKSIKAEGVLALYKGFLPTWARLGPWQLCFWVVYEQMRTLTGVGAF